MPLVINTNVASLNAQRNLNNSQSALQTSLQRLSTGLRINSAKDDAAGLAIAERFTAQIRGLNQATRNANDGISFAQTAEGALGTIGNALQRIRELAVQSANDTNSASDRQALNNEVQQLIAEVNRVANSTQFNGQNILDGTLSELVFQVGANRGQTISVTGVDARTSQLGAEVATGGSITLSTFTGVNDGTEIAEGDFTDVSLNGVAIDLSGAGSIEDVVSAINTALGDTGVQAIRSDSVVADNLGVTAPTTAGVTSTLTINGVAVEIAVGDTATEVIGKINDVSEQTGVTAEAGSTSGVKLTSGQDITIEFEGAEGAFAGLATGEQESYLRGIDLATDVGDTISSGGTDATGLGFANGAETLETFTAAAVSVATREDASDALRTVDFALQQVSGLRAELGAVQTRFESTISNLGITAENLSAARSRIQDADFAAETAALTRAQILQQAGTSVLAQANAIPQNVLSLLQ
jgi:flagellin